MSRLCFRKTVLSAMLTTVIGSGALLPHITSAHAAAPAISFHPTKAWNIAQRDRGCVAQNEFNNGFVLSFSGSRQWVNALDVNFRQDAFKKGDLYKISLSVPGLASTYIKAPAISNNTIRIDLKGNKEIYKKMRVSGVVDMTVEGNDFRFYLTGFSNSAIEFERCMSGGDIKPHEGGLVAKRNEQDKQLVSSAHQVTSADKENYMKNEAMAFEEAQSAAFAKKTKERLPEVSDENLVPPAPESIAEIQGSLKSESLDKSPILPAPISAKEVHELKAVSVGDTPARVVNHKTPKMKVNKETGHMKADFREIDKAPKKMPITRTESNSVLLDRISGLESKLGLMASENIALTEDLKKSLRATEKETMAISSENWNLEQATMQFNEAERQIKRLGIQLQSERAKCEAEKKELEVMLFDPQLTDESQLARLATLEQQLDKAKRETESQRLRYEEQIRMLRGTAAQ